MTTNRRKTSSDVPQVSVIILNYNAEKFLRDTLKSVAAQLGLKVETIVVDNQSSDNSREMVAREFPSVRWVQRDTSVGFAAGNNAGLPYATADTILFLNPDASFQHPDDLKKCYDRLQRDPSIGCLTARVNLALTGKIDVTCHRGFPTPWAAFTHFSGLAKLFPRVPFFNYYTKSYLGYGNSHDIDAVGGMFMLMPRRVGEKVGWWDETYPLYGEDLDFCYRIHEAGFRNFYYASVTVLHYKGVSTGMSKQSRSVTTAKKATTRRVKGWSIQAMEIFYRKHYARKYPFLLNWLVYAGIKLLKFRRTYFA